MSRTLLMGALALAGCTVHSVNRKPTPPVAVPAAFEGASGGALGDGRWWGSFADPELAALIEQSLSGSLELRQWWARLAQARAIADGAAAGLYPTVDAQLDAGGQRSSVLNPLTGDSQSITSARYGASLPVSYELDLWGRVRSAKAAADQDVLASRDDVETAAMTITANVAESYFDVLEQRASRRLLEALNRTNSTALELIELRFRMGESVAADVYQQRQLLQSIDAQVPLTRAREAVARRQLAVLTGRSVATLAGAGGDALPVPPALPGVGIPSTLLARRPDVRAAQRRVVAADYRVGEAIAARYPALRLTGSVGLQTHDLVKIFDDFVWSLGAILTQNLFDGGRRAAQVRLSKAVLEERLSVYGLALQRAIIEVEGALITEQELTRNIELLALQVETSRLALEAAEARYRQGLADYLVVLTALRTFDQVQQSLLSARRQILSTRLQLVRALGGTWTHDLAPPAPLRKDEDEG